MPKVIIHEKPDTSIAIIIPAPNGCEELGFTEQQHLDYLIQRLVPQGESTTIIEDSEIPLDRTFRDAWEWNGSQIVVNQTKAIEIRATQLEIVRTQKIDALTEEIQIAEDDGLSSTALRDQRKQARELDLTNALDGVSIEDLKTYVPLELS